MFIGAVVALMIQDVVYDDPSKGAFQDTEMQT